MSDAKGKRVILVMGRGTDDRGNLSCLSESNAMKAVYLFTEDPTQYIIFSARYWAGLKTPPQRTEAAMMRDLAVAMNVDQKRILLEEKSLDSIGGVYYSEKIIRRMGKVAKITLVATDYHMPRCRYSFVKMFKGRCALAYAPAQSRLPQADLEVISMAEKEKRLRDAKGYGDIRDGDSAAFIRRIEKVHGLYAKRGRAPPGPHAHKP